MIYKKYSTQKNVVSRVVVSITFKMFQSTGMAKTGPITSLKDESGVVKKLVT